jgi:hypothetical protein
MSRQGSVGAVEAGPGVVYVDEKPTPVHYTLEVEEPLLDGGPEIGTHRGKLTATGAVRLEGIAPAQLTDDRLMLKDEYELLVYFHDGKPGGVFPFSVVDIEPCYERLVAVLRNPGHGNPGQPDAES